MTKNLIFLAFLVVSLFSYSQNEHLNPDNKLIQFQLDASQLTTESFNNLLSDLPQIMGVKELEVDGTSIIVNFINHNDLRPNEQKNYLKGNLSAYITQYQLKVNFQDQGKILNNFKAESVTSKTILLSGVSNDADIAALESVLLQKEIVQCVNFNLDSHELYIIYDANVDDQFFNELIKSTGKQIISGAEEISKYY